MARVSRLVCALLPAQDLSPFIAPLKCLRWRQTSIGNDASQPDLH